MRILLFMSGMFVALGSFPQPLWAQSPTPERVFLLIGQSNMAGRAALEKGDDEPIPGVSLLTDQGKWEAAKNPLNRYSNIRKDLSMQRVGPGYGFARKMRELDPQTSIGLVVNARGGTSIEEWAKGKKLYDETLKRLQSQAGLKIDGVLWHQGENNAKDPNYLEKAVTLIETLRKDLNSPDLPWVVGEVAGTFPVNDALRAIPGKVKNTAVVSAKDLKLFDDVHFDRASQTQLGARYAEAMQKLLPKKK